MKKYITNFICILLCFVFCLSLCSCDKKKGESTVDEGNNETIDKIYENKKQLEGTLHYYNVGESNVPFITNGLSDYTIVFPENVKDNGDLSFAISELKYFVEESSGLRLKSMSDADNNGNDKIISLGSTLQMQGDSELKSLLSTTSIGDNGFIIKTKGNSVYIFGNKPLSIVWGVYEFLHQQLGYKYYAENCYSLDKNVTNINLKNMEIVDVPDIQYNVNGNGEDQISIAHYRRMKMCSYYDFYVSGTAFCHNTFDLVDKETREQHPEWVATTGKQLCFSSDVEGLSNYILEQLKILFENDIYHDYVPVMHQDGGYWCTCANCTKEYGKYDDDISANSAMFFGFINKVADGLKEWNKKECPERDLKIAMIAYGPLLTPPVKIDDNKNPILTADGKYQPYSDELVLRDNVIVQVAGGVVPIGTASDDEKTINESNDRFLRWRAVAKEFLAWSYSANFANYFAPRNYVDERDDVVQFFVKNGIVLWFDNAKYDTPYSSDFAVLKSYVNGQLAWNSSLSLNKLIDEFIENYFGEASEKIKEMFAGYRAYMNYLSMENIYPITNEVDASHFPAQIILGFLEQLQEAQNSIEDIKLVDKVKYEELSKRIQRETMSWRYCYLTLYGEMYEFNYLQSQYNKFLDDCYKVGISYGCEHTIISNFLNR